MPYKSRRRCRHPHCPELVNAGEVYCPAHRPVRKNASAYYDRRWQKVRALYLSKHPLCADCEKNGRLTPATDVHHIVKPGDGGNDSENNLMGLCRPCHSARTARGE